MKRTLIALVASAALALPAVAAEQSPLPNSSNDAAGSMQDQSSINLTRAQIQMMQRNLNNNGFKAGRVDGVIGPETEAALKQFQQQKGLNASGQPDGATLSALLATPGPASRSYARNRPQNQPQSEPQSQPQNEPESQSQTMPQNQQRGQQQPSR